MLRGELQKASVMRHSEHVSAQTCVLAKAWTQYNFFTLATRWFGKQWSGMLLFYKRRQKVHIDWYPVSQILQNE